MKIILFFLVIIFMCHAVSAQDYKVVKKEALKTLRAFRDTISLDTNVNKSHLLINTNNVIYIAKSLTDTTQLKGLLKYFKHATSVYAKTSEEEKTATINLINEDLSMKLGLGESMVEDSSIVLAISSTTSFGTKRNLSITAHFREDSRPKGDCRVYWFNYLGGKQETIVRQRYFEGNSDGLVNPYNLNLSLPGYITFWLEDLNSGKLYMSDFVYKKLTTERGITVFFKLLLP